MDQNNARFLLGFSVSVRTGGCQCARVDCRDWATEATRLYSLSFAIMFAALTPHAVLVDLQRHIVLALTNAGSEMAAAVSAIFSLGLRSFSPTMLKK